MRACTRFRGPRTKSPCRKTVDDLKPTNPHFSTLSALGGLQPSLIALSVSLETEDDPPISSSVLYVQNGEKRSEGSRLVNRGAKKRCACVSNFWGGSHPQLDAVSFFDSRNTTYFLTLNCMPDRSSRDIPGSSTCSINVLESVIGMTIRGYTPHTTGAGPIELLPVIYFGHDNKKNGPRQRRRR